MSRTFSKILVICAMITILPLLVVGTTLAAYNSISNSVKVEIVVNNDLTAEQKEEYQAYANKKETYVKVREKDGEEKDSLTISKAHNKNVTVEAFYTDNAYEFVGWFVGDAQAYKNKLTSGITENDYASTEADFTFNMSDAKNYVAVYERKTFNVTYSYELQPEGAVVTTAPESDPRTSFKFGEKLPVLTVEDSLKEEYKFANWEVNGTRYIYADFEKADSYVLTNPWSSVEKVTITFNVNGRLLTRDYAIGSQLTKEKIKADLKKEDVDLDTLLDAGYTFEWYDGENSIGNGFEVEQAITLVAKKDYIRYKASLTTKDGELAEGVEPADITFKIDDSASVFNPWFNLETKYGFDRIVAIKYNDVSYASEAGGEVKALTEFITSYVNSNPKEAPASAATFELVIQSVDNLAFTSAEVLYDAYDSPEVPPQEHAIYDEDADPFSIAVNSDTGVSTDLTIAELLGTSEDGKGYYLETEKTTKVKLIGIRISHEGQVMSWIKFDENFNLNSTVKDLLQILYEDAVIFGDSDLDGSLKFTLDKIGAVFGKDAE